MKPLPSKIINLVLLKRPPLDIPYALDDSVLAVQNLLARAGFSTHFSFNSIDPSQINVLFGLQMPGTATLAQIRSIASPKNTLIFNCEQLDGGSHWVTNEYLNLITDFVCLDYNISNVEHLNRWSGGRANIFEFPVVPSPDFRRDCLLASPLPDIAYDLAFYGSSANGNRMERLQALVNQGVSLKCFAGLFGKNLPQGFMDCTGILNIHGYDSGLFETGRCLRPVSLGIPVFSDVSRLPSIVNWENSGIFFLPKENFTESVTDILRNSHQMLDASQRMIAFVNDPNWPTLAKEVMLTAIDTMNSKS